MADRFIRPEKTLIEIHYIVGLNEFLCFDGLLTLFSMFVSTWFPYSLSLSNRLEIHLFSNFFEQWNICFRHTSLKTTNLGKSSTNRVIPPTMLQNSSSLQENSLTSSNSQLLSTIIKTVLHLYTNIDNLKLLNNQQNVFEINKKVNDQVYFSLSSSYYNLSLSFSCNTSPPSSLIPQPLLLL